MYQRSRREKYFEIFTSKATQGMSIYNYHMQPIRLGYVLSRTQIIVYLQFKRFQIPCKLLCIYSLTCKKPVNLTTETVGIILIFSWQQNCKFK